MQAAITAAPNSPDEGATAATAAPVKDEETPAEVKATDAEDKPVSAASSLLFHCRCVCVFTIGVS